MAYDLALARQAPEFKKLKALLSNREWRLDNLYFIRDDEGVKIKFVRNEAQRTFMAGMTGRNALPKSRKLGFSTLISILITDACMFIGGTRAGIIDRTLDDATDKLAIIKFAYDSMPAEVRAPNPLVRATDEYLEWKNGSSVSVGTSYRGGTPSILHVSEYGKISVDKPDVAREIKTGAMQAVPASGTIFIESTAHGTSGEFHDVVKRAQALADTGRQPTELDYTLQFFGWWIKKEYRVANNLVIVPASTTKYLNGVEKEIGRKLDADQRAWYQKKLEELGPDDIKEEFPSTVDELFFVSLEGAFWREEIGRARREGRIGGDAVPFDPTRPVTTWWDIGEDMTAIWFHQTDGVRHRFVDYWEEEGASLQKGIGVLDDKRRDRGFVYGEHLGPHDLENKDWANNSKTRKQSALEFGVKFRVIPRVSVKDESIEAARRLLNLSWFDPEHCAVGTVRLENYSKKWNKQLSQYTSEPVHNVHSHGADAFQQGAMGVRPEKVKDGDKPGRDRAKRSQWGA